MPAPSQLTVAQIDRSIVESLERVFNTMARMPIKLVERTTDQPPVSLGDGGQIMGCVGFVGEMNGIIHLRFTEEFAVMTTSQVLGMSTNEVIMEGPDVLKDTIGELTNMSVGGFKNAFSDIGLPCALTLPTIIRGQNLCVPTIKGTTRHVYHFSSEGNRFLADLQIKPD